MLGLVWHAGMLHAVSAKRDAGWAELVSVLESTVVCPACVLVACLELQAPLNLSVPRELQTAALHCPCLSYREGTASPDENI